MSDDEPLAPTALAPRSIHPSAGILLPSDWITLGAPVEHRRQPRHQSAVQLRVVRGRRVPVKVH